MRRAAAAFSCGSRGVPRVMFSTRPPILFTPGPLTTTRQTKQPMMKDYGSRDPAFMEIVRDVRASLLRLGNVTQASGYECVLVQGSGTFGIEAVLGSTVPRSGGHVLIAVNGAYGRRLGAMCDVLGIRHTDVVFAETEPVDVNTVIAELRRVAGVTHVALVHHETTAGVLNPMGDLGRAIAAAAPGVTYIVDSMSAFGAYPADLARDQVHFLVSSSNKCIEGVPGFSYALCERNHLEACKGNARSLSLDLHAQWAGLESNGQFRFTPPTHAIAAFHAALAQHELAGGCAGRLAKYQANFALLKRGMLDLGFHILVPDGPQQGCIISTFLYPDDARFDFERFYELLAGAGCLIYPGKLTRAACFRIGNIGDISAADVSHMLATVRSALQTLGVATPVKQVAVV